MIKKISKMKLIQRLEILQGMADKESSEPVLVSLGKWLESNSTGTFDDYIKEQLKNKASDVTVIIDDLILGSGLYILTDLIFGFEKDRIKEFIKAARESDEIKFMELYIKAFDETFEDLGDVPDEDYFMTTPSLNFLHDSKFSDGKQLSNEELRHHYYESELSDKATAYDVYAEIFEKYNLLFYKDFLEHYKVLSIEELVERYKDVRFHKMITEKHR